jgi:hypothetical protein
MADQRSPFEKVLDDLGCRCACHTGIGSNTACEHCSTPTHRFTVSSYVHAHDLGRVPCVICGRLYMEHLTSASQSRSPEPAESGPIGPLAMDQSEVTE